MTPPEPRLPGRAIAQGVALGLVVTVLVAGLGARLGVLAPAPTLSGPWPWVASRAAGVTALVALAADVILGLGLSTRLGDRWLPRGAAVELHRRLGGLALGLTAGHALLLLGDAAVRFDLLALLVPGTSAYRRLPVAVGVLAAYAAVVVQVSFGLRARLGARTWRRLHHLSFVALVGALAHGLAAGTDTGRPAMRVLYVLIASVVGALVTWRLLQAAGAPAAGARPPARSRQ